MPSSNLALAGSILAMAAEVNPSCVLDVGPGNGKYGLLLREYVARDLVIDAVESEPRYERLFPWVEPLYRHVYYRDVCSMELLGEYDLVLMIDVLEHLSVADGVALLERIPGRVIVCTPMEFFQNPEADHGWDSERHRSCWSVHDVAAIRKLEVDDAYAASIGGVLVRTAPL